MVKKYYITTAIPYANGVPHIGHVLDVILADIWARYQKQNGVDVRFQAGLDEHGNKIFAKAKEVGQDPKTFADGIQQHFVNLIKSLNVNNTDYVRTTDSHHNMAVQYIWQKLQTAGLIYKGSYEGWYCTGCENFVTDKEAAINNGICPDHQKTYERLNEENYYFKASQFTNQVREAIESNKLKIIPESRKNEILELLKDGLPDVSASRPLKNLSWGIPVPGDPSQVIYVWIDALTNYITVIGYPDRPQEFNDYWPTDVTVVGKDILRFHAGIWPAILMGLDLPLPKILLVHGFMSVNGAKMSKSLGNGVSPFDVINSYGSDAFRYYFSRHVPTQDDGDFSYEKFETAYNSELGDDLGNLVQRVASMILRYQAGVIGDEPQAEHDMAPYHQAMQDFEYNKALDITWNTVRSLNRYLESVKPWMIAKNLEKDPEAAPHLAEVLAHAVSTLKQIADFVEPFMPETSGKIRAIFGTGVVPSNVTPLFPKIYNYMADPRAKKADATTN